ncbi:MAG: HAMP domain-containing histidine kinase [Fusobacteriaceae bacterium]|nr:HAMP domain-containing histidine kinase [Fusobacteriaceae bacterium]
MKIRDICTSKLFTGTVFAFFIFNIFTYFTFSNKQRIIVDEKKEIFDLSIKNLVSELLWQDDLNTLKSAARNFINREEVISIKVYDEFKNIKVSYETSTPKSDDLTSQLNLIMNGNVIGYLEITYNYDALNKSIRSIYISILQIEFGFILILLISMILHFKVISTYIYRVSDNLLQLNNGNTDNLLHLNLKSIKPIEENFNRLVTKIKNEKNLQKRNIEDFIHTKDELEAAYNQMISINAVLETTLSSLELSEGKYKNIFKYSPFGIALYNIENSKVEDYNEELLRIFDNPNEKNLDLIFKNDGIFDLAKAIYNPNERKDEEFFLISANKIVILSVVPFKSDKKYIQIFFKDITELKTLQIKLQDYAKDLEKEVALQTRHLKEANGKIKNQQQKLVEDAYNKGLIEVTSGIIHNIGNIVNVISLSFDELITSKESNENILPKFLDSVILKELNNLPDLANSSPNLNKAKDILPKLLEYHNEFEQEFKNKIEFLLKKVYHLKEVVQLQQNFVGSLGTEDYNDITNIADEVLEIYDSSLIKRNIKVQKSYTDKPQILCDKAQIIQLISNFIKNSYEAIEEKDMKEGLIKISSYIKDNNFFIELYDNGIGIKENNLNKLFEFGYSTKKENGSGSGFGLHSCKNIVEKYGGTINVESTYELYTKFIISIPLKKDNYE